MFGTDDNGVNLSRRQWLRGEFRAPKPPMRPPWAISEAQFKRVCTQCSACIRACELELLKLATDGFPEIQFTESGCDFCGDCLRACECGALDAPVPAPNLAWSHRAVLQPDCLSLNGVICRSCAEACDVEAIRFKLQVGGRAIPLLDQARCNGCGECVAVCPNDSISLEILEEPQP